MLIRFKVSNFLSFKEETEFSMVAGKERIHQHHIIKGKKNQPNLLRAALLYGANAAGKSNFVKAIDYARELIIKGRDPEEIFLIDRNTSLLTFNDAEFDRNKFRFGKSNDKRPSQFSFEFVSNQRVFEYSFSINAERIIDERLVELSKESEKLLFERKINKKGNITFAETNFLKSKDDKEFLKFVQRSTPSDKLFLTQCKDNNVEWFQSIYNWFENTLEIIYPNSYDSRLEIRLRENNAFNQFFRELNKKAGTGILSFEIVDFYGRRDKRGRPSDIIFPSSLLGDDVIKRDIVEKIPRLKLFHDNENISQKSILTETYFEKEQESDGTQRLFDLAFPFYDLATSETPKVYIIDELERNLHTNLSYMLLKSYLEQEGKGQLIATTHDTHLLDLDLLRRDEIWFAEKDKHGATQLYSLYEFNPRYDKKIEKEYLTGRFGAIPFLGNFEFKKKLAKNGKSKK